MCVAFTILGGEGCLDTPFCDDIVQGVWTGNGEGDEDDVGLAVGEGPQAFVVFLSRRVPQRELN